VKEAMEAEGKRNEIGMKMYVVDSAADSTFQRRVGRRSA
jgi:hypothetical protein